VCVGRWACQHGNCGETRAYELRDEGDAPKDGDSVYIGDSVTNAMCTQGCQELCTSQEVSPRRSARAAGAPLLQCSCSARILTVFLPTALCACTIHLSNKQLRRPNVLVRMEQVADSPITQTHTPLRKTCEKFIPYLV
jgi:hypothetical protein